HDDDIGIRDARFEIGSRLVRDWLQLWVACVEGVKRSRSMVSQQIVQAPRGAGLKGNSLVPQSDQLSQHAAEEVHVAIVPARGERVREVDEPHARTSLPARWRRLDSRPP